MPFNAKKKAVLERIEHLEPAIVRAKEYLESGKHAKWEGFRHFFVAKLKDGKELPPHRDWVKNVFLPRCERSLGRAEKVLERLTHKELHHAGYAVEPEGQDTWEE